MTAHFKAQHAEKMLVKINDSTQLRPGSAVLISSDKDGRNVLSLTMDTNIKKELAFQNIYGDSFYLHYPVFPHLNYSFCLTEDSASLQVLEQPIYHPIIRFEDHSNVGKLVCIIH